MPSDSVAFARRYLDAIERGDDLRPFFTADVIQHELPNRLVPQGAKRGLGELLEGAERGKKVVSTQRYEILHAVADGEHLALEVRWTATLAVPVGTLPAGGEMRAQFGVFLDLRDGKIAGQRNYDCFEPF